MTTNIVVLEQWQVVPSPGGPIEKLLPLSDFDIIFLRFPIMQLLFFYDLHCSKSHFLGTLVPNLKNSLSLTLKHFSPLAGKTILPLTSGTPFTHYVAGDSVPLTISQSDADFVHLIGNHYRDADDFCDLVPPLPQATFLSDSIKFSLSAFQVTYFPGRGICIGVTIHHSIFDGATLLCFLQAWSSIAKSNNDSHLLASAPKCLPSFDRSAIIKNAERRLSTETSWDRVKKSRRVVTLSATPPTHNVRAVFVLSDKEIRQLKKIVLHRKPGIPNYTNVSTFVLVCAYLWSCFAKSSCLEEEEEVADDEPVYLAFPGDCRAHLDPPLPDTYFGNCVAFMIGESTHGRLRGKEGIVEGVLAIREAIHKTFNNDKGVVDVSGYQKFKKLNRRWVFIIAGSPRHDMDGNDFGWGRAKKTEFMHIDSRESVSIMSNSIGFDGVQIGLSMSKVGMDAFAAVFEQGIRESTAEEKIFHSKI